MPEDYKHEDWISLYEAALTELEHAKMSGCVEAAQTAIFARMEKLVSLPGLHPEERQAIVCVGVLLQRPHASGAKILD